MKRIGVSAELERAIRWAAGSETEIDTTSLTEILVQVRDLLDAKPAPKTPGISYHDIVRAFREVLGDNLVVPANPHVSWLVRQVNRVKELGLTYEHLIQIALLIQSRGTRSVELEWLVRNASRLLHECGTGQSDGKGSKIITGRHDDE